MFWVLQRKTFFLSSFFTRNILKEELLSFEDKQLLSSTQESNAKALTNVDKIEV